MSLYLDAINDPSDLKKLTDKQKAVLCQEIREKMIETVSRTGGHLASNLGIVELTVALHSVFNCPKDTIIFDVGHSAAFRSFNISPYIIIAIRRIVKLKKTDFFSKNQEKSLDLLGCMVYNINRCFITYFFRRKRVA